MLIPGFQLLRLLRRDGLEQDRRRPDLVACGDQPPRVSRPLQECVAQLGYAWWKTQLLQNLLGNSLLRKMLETPICVTFMCI